MRSVLLLATLLGSHSVVGTAQSTERFVSQDYATFFDWFHQHSQVNDLYANHSTLYIFGYEAQVYAKPSRSSEKAAVLEMGQAVQNIAYPGNYLPEDEIDGYGDIWYHVTGRDRLGKVFRGYVWGADIARGWRRADITGDGSPEFILLGLCSRPRQGLKDINAELRVLQRGRLIGQQLIPGLCIFEDCASSPMLRVLEDSNHPGLTIIETSTMTIGCEVGIEKAFFFWNGRRLDRVYQAEYTTQQQMWNKEFSFPVRDEQTGTVTAFQICSFSHEDENFNPVWDCRTVPVETGKDHFIPAADADVKARAR